MTVKSARLYRIHRLLAPIMVLPLLLTAITGSLYQIADASGQEEQYDWLLDLHKGHFGGLNLVGIYPYLNALGLLTLAITGILIWFNLRRRGGLS